MSEEMPEDVMFTALQLALAGTWSVERRIGHGGMATVYLARDVALDRPVAIKVLDGQLATDPEARERFLREARTGARLTHPHIVPVYAVEEAAGTVYIVMGFVDGESLRERMFREGPLPADAALRVMREIGWALSYAHAMGTLHRDITLDNILIDRRTGRAMLVDFGIAAEIDRAEAGPLIGTPAYLAPELIQGEPASPASDLYALGVTSWAMLSGRLPYQAEETGALLLQHLTEDIPSLASAAPGAPSRLVRAAESCLAKSPHERPPSVEQWLQQLDAKQTEIVISGPLGRWVDQWRHVKGFYALAFSAVAMLAFTRFNYLDFDDPVATLGVLVSLVLLPLSIAGLVHRWSDARWLRKIAKAGYRISDITIALRRSQQRKEIIGGETTLVRVLRSVRKLSAGVFLLLLLFTWILWTAIEGEMTLHGHGPWPWYFKFHSFDTVERILGWLLLTFFTSTSLLVLLPSTPSWFSRWRDRHRLRFWEDPLGRGVFRLLSSGISVHEAPAETLHRPTELVLDLEIEDLWHALPETTRRGLRSVPGLATSLRKGVSELRVLSESIDRPGALVSGDLRTIRDRLAARQADGVTALERLRMMLCQLGVQTASDGILTAQLQDLHVVENEMLAELGAHADLRRLTQHGQRTPVLSPVVTPA